MCKIYCVLATENTHENLPYTVSENVWEMWKFSVVENMYAMNRKSGLCYTSWNFPTQIS